MAEMAGRWMMLASGWLAVTIVLVLLAQVAGAGPIAWFDSWLAVRTGQIRGLMIAMLVLVLPAAWLLAAAIGRANLRAVRTPATGRRFRATATILCAVGILCLMIAGFGWLRYTQAMDDAEKAEAATELTSGTSLAEAAAARRRIAMVGAPIERRSIRFVWGDRRAAGFSTYTGFRPGGMRRDTMAEGANAPPVAIFIETVGRPSGPGTPLEHRPQQDRVEGYLVENGLPDHARTVLTRENVRISSPHYLLRADRDGPVQRHITTTIVGGLTGAMLLLFALSLARKAAAMGREAA